MEGNMKKIIDFVKENYNLDEEFSFTVSEESIVKIILPKQTIAYIEIK
jgi:hypothetical protein